MDFIDILIAFFIGVFVVLYPTMLVKTTAGNFEKKKKRLKNIGYLLICIAIVSGIIKVVI